MQNKILTSWDCTESDADVTLATTLFPRCACTLDPIKATRLHQSTRALDRVHRGPTPCSLPSTPINR